MNPQEETFISNFKSRRSPWHYDCNNSYFINNFTACKWYEQVGHIRQRKILKLLLQRFVINATPPPPAPPPPLPPIEMLLLKL